LYRVPIHGTTSDLLQSSDVLILLALYSVEPDWTLRSVAERLGVKHSKVQRALERLERAGLYDARRRKPIRPATEEFLIHALRYLHPLEEGPVVRGFPTAWGAEPLRRVISSEEPPPVWPDPAGPVRGPAVEPLDERLPALIDDWPEVASWASLADALRVGDTRTRAAAADHFRAMLASR
jgi:DNA-binding transcriptional MocR family regulator